MSTLSLSLTLLLAIFVLVSLPSRSFGYIAGQITIAPPTKSTVQPESCNEFIIPDSKQGAFYEITPGCSPHFFHYCVASRGLNETDPNRNVSYVPNCLGQETQEDMKRTLDIMDVLVARYVALNPPNVTVKCLNLLVPYLCNAVYPPANAAGKAWITPCQSFCEEVFEACDGLLDGVEIDLPIKNCSQMCVYPEPTEGPKIDRDDFCVRSPLKPSDCFKECPVFMDSLATKSITKCSKEQCKCHTNQVRTSISKRQFPKRNFQFSKYICNNLSITLIINYYIGAEVKVLEEVHLCEPVLSIAYKVEIIRDFFLQCKKCEGKYCRELPSGSITYVLSTDSINSCDKRCIQPKIEIEEKYLMSGTFHSESEKFEEECNSKLWVLDSVRKANSLLYPWNKYTGENKNGRPKNQILSEAIMETYKCKAPCRRYTIA